MRKIPLDDAVAGDVLAEPLTNATGQVLLPRGARLSAAVLSRCRGWGVHTLCVEGEDADAIDVQQLLDNLDFRFAGFEDDALMTQVKAVAREHLTQA